MKKTLLLVLLSCVTTFINAQKFNELINLNRYADSNSKIDKPAKNEKRVVFLGNSITEGWANQRPDFFSSNSFIGRGISGQTSPQLLSRFRSDVINLQPIAVVINIGINDIAENSGPFDPEFTLGNIISMAQLAKANKIKVILTSILPAAGFGWNPSITGTVDKIDNLNKQIEAYAKANKFLYVDYNSELRDENGALKSHYGDDGVHPNTECYQLMESIVLKVLQNNKIVNKK